VPVTLEATDRPAEQRLATTRWGLSADRIRLSTRGMLYFAILDLLLLSIFGVFSETEQLV
jgi:hypothetical protein